MLCVAIFVIVLILFYFYGTRNFDYWAKRGVKHDKPIPFFGNAASRFLLRASMASIAADVYKRYPNERFVGSFTGNTPELVIRDPDLIKSIMVTEFHSFYERSLSAKHGVIEPLLKNLVFIDGDIWKLLRQKLTPAFSSGKLRAMFPLVLEKANRLKAKLLSMENEMSLDARDVMARYTTDLIGTVGFGVDSDCTTQNDSEFRKLAAKIFNINFRRAMALVLKSMFPNIFKHVKVLGQDLEDEVLSLVYAIMKQRNYKPCGRNDFIDLLLEIKESDKLMIESLEHFNRDGSPKMVDIDTNSEELMAAQAFIFFAAGFETSSSATSYTLFELAFNKEVQKKLQMDIDRVLDKYDNSLCYDAIKEMSYLEWTFLEAMRKFPPAGHLMRRVTRKYNIPDTSIIVDKGVHVTIPIQGIHNDPKYFDNPEEFKPERFAPDEVSKRHKFVYLPFGAGPRSCIGERLGKMQSLAGLAAVLSEFSVEPAPETKRHLTPDPRSTVVQTIIGGIPLKFIRRKKTKNIDQNGTYDNRRYFANSDLNC